jgi:hypothetical protein
MRCVYRSGENGLSKRWIKKKKCDKKKEKKQYVLSFSFNLASHKLIFPSFSGGGGGGGGF